MYHYAYYTNNYRTLVFLYILSIQLFSTNSSDLNLIYYINHNFYNRCSYAIIFISKFKNEGSSDRTLVVGAFQSHIFGGVFYI